MKLDEFITNVLQDIHTGLQNAENKTGKGYFIEVSDKKGVQFDIAVTVLNSENTTTEGKAQAGIIQVLGAGIGTKIENKEESNKVSRIQFTVYVPPKTKQQEKEENDKWNENNRNDLSDL